MTKPIKKILLLIAMQAEADPIIRALHLDISPHIIDSQLPFRAYANCKSDPHIFLIVSGADPRYHVDNIGTQAATLMAYIGIEQFQPDLAISAGTAGGFASLGAQVGTVYLSDEEFIFHDRIVPLKGFEEQGIGHYPAANVRVLAKRLQLPLGKISSGSSFKKDPAHLASILKTGAVAKEMEAAAIAWVCWLKDVPLVAIKSITNLLDKEQTSEQQFITNLALATECLSTCLLDVLNDIRGKNLAGLGD